MRVRGEGATMKRRCFSLDVEAVLLALSVGVAMLTFVWGASADLFPAVESVIQTEEAQQAVRLALESGALANPTLAEVLLSYPPSLVDNSVYNPVDLSVYAVSE